MRQGDSFQTYFCFFKKTLYKVKASGRDLKFNMFWWTLTWTNNKNKRYNISDCWSRDLLNFDFLWNGLGLASLPHFVNNISRKIFFKLYSINLPNFIVWLALLLKISGNMWNAIICCPVCKVTDFEMNLSFLIKPFSCMIKEVRRKFKYLQNKKSF